MNGAVESGQRAPLRPSSRCTPRPAPGSRRDRRAVTRVAVEREWSVDGPARLARTDGGDADRRPVHRSRAGPSSASSTASACSPTSADTTVHALVAQPPAAHRRLPRGGPRPSPRCRSTTRSSTARRPARGAGRARPTTTCSTCCGSTAATSPRVPLEARRAPAGGLPFAAAGGARARRCAATRRGSAPAATGWEGVIAKRRDSPYEHRRSKHWLKMKCEASQELVVGGFTDPQGARVGLGALLVGYFEERRLRLCRQGRHRLRHRRCCATLRARLDGWIVTAPPSPRAPACRSCASTG